MVYVRRELAIIQFYAMVARNGFINDVVEWKEVCVMQASRSSGNAVRLDTLITDELNNDLHMDTGNGVSLEKVDKFFYLGDSWMQMEDVIQQ